METFLLFVIYSFFGCVLEDGYHLLINGKYMSKRTLINLPLCPVYGISCILLSALNRPHDSVILLFCTGFVAVSSVELAFYLMSQKLYGVRMWDYSGLKYQFMGGISLKYSIMWGILNIVFARVADPVFRNGVAAIGYNVKPLLCAFVAVYLCADVKQTHIELKKFKNGEESLVSTKLKYIKLNNSQTV